MKKIFISAGLILAGWSATAQQDIHFSQFYSAPGFINPATTGVMNGQVRGYASYRSQWSTVSTPFTTITAAGDIRLFEDNLEGGFMGVGVLFYNDKAGATNLTTGTYGINLSYAIELSEDAFLSIGVQPVFLQKSISYSGLYYGNQWYITEFDKELPNGETNFGDEASAFDLGAGIYYLNRYSDHSAVYFGGSASHLTAPTISFQGNNDPLIRKYIFHGGLELGSANSNVVVLPNTLMKFQGPNQIINVGTDVKFVMQKQSHFTGLVDEKSWGLGAYYRFGDAFWGTAQFNWTGFTVAVSYDLNLSDLTVASNGLGGMEVVMMYRAGIGHGKGKSTRFL